MINLKFFWLQLGKNRDNFRRSSYGLSSGLSTTALSVCRICDLKMSELVEFLNQDRLHNQQGIFPDVQQTYLLHSSLNFDEVSLRVLAGASLKANDFLKLEQTCLADVVVEESGNEHFREHESQLEPVALQDIEVSEIYKVKRYSSVF